MCKCTICDTKAKEKEHLESVNELSVCNIAHKLVQQIFEKQMGTVICSVCN